MKNFKIALCALLVLCSGLFFAACGGEKTKTFDASKISTVDETAVYDGNSHVFTVKYDGVKNVNVTYSETKNGSFVSKDKLGLVDVGEYEVYYKLSAKGYESYISANPLTFTINKRPYSFEFGEGSTFQFNVNDNFDINEVVCYTHNVVGNDDVVPQFKIYKHDEPNTLFPTNPAEIANLAGQTYDIALTGIEGSDADNYSFVSESERTATLKLINNIMVKNGETETYYKTLADAISNATQQGDIVQLTRDVEIDQTIEINSSVTINGFGHKITISNDFVPGSGDGQNGRNIFAVKNAAATLTFENVVIDGVQKVTCVTVVDGKILLNNGAKIINGKRTFEGLTDAREIDKLVGGLFLTGKSELIMEGGEISGNSNAVEGEYEREVRKYASDLWIGSEAKATISGGLIGNMFINANSSQAADSLTKVNGAAHIENAFVELDGGKYANLDLESDSLIDNIIVKVGTNQEGEDKVRTYSNEQVVTGKYKGGFGLVSIKSGDTEFATLQDAVDSVANQGIIEIFHNIEIDSQVNLPSNKEFTITSADDAQYEIGVTADFEGTAMLSADGNTNNLKLTLKNIVIDGRLKTSCLYLTNTELTVTNDAVVCNGKLMAEDDANTEKLLNGGVYMTGKSTFTMDGGLIKDNHNADKDGVEFGSKQEDEIYLFAKDLWLGSEVKANITGGEIGSIWVNANKSSNDEPDEEGYGLTVSGSAKIENVYLDYYNDNNGEAYGTTLQYGCAEDGGVDDECTAEIEEIILSYYYVEGENPNYLRLNGATRNAYNLYKSGFVGTMIRPDISELSNFPDIIYLDYETFKLILEDGLGDNDANYVIDLRTNIKLSNTQFIKQNVTINGYEHTISAIKNVENFGATTEGTYQGKENRSLFMIPCGDEYANLEVKFNNVTLDGNGLARGLSLYKGKTTLENVIIKNGKAADNSWSGGIFLTGDAELSINECTITGNVQYDEEIESEKAKIDEDEYINYAADLWVGANAKVVVESSAVDNNTIGNVWVNANEYSQNNQGSFTLTNGEIENVWLEYDKGYGAILNVNSGVVKNLYISQGYTENEYNEPVVVANAEAGKYVGGANAYVTKNDTKVYGYFEELVTDTDIDEVRLVADVEVKKVIKIENERSLTIDGENGDEKFTIKASTEFAKEDNLNGTSLSTIFYVKQATLTIRDAILNGNSVARAISSFAGGETNAYIYLENVEVAGGKDVDGRHSGGVFLSDKTIATLTNCTINENVGAEAVKDERLNYAADLWIGSEVKATIYKGSYGKIFVNANKYTIDDEVNLTIDENASINAMWVEYDIKGATVNLISGSIGLLYVASTENGLTYYNEYNFTVRAGEESKTLKGGVSSM